MWNKLRDAFRRPFFSQRQSCCGDRMRAILYLWPPPKSARGNLTTRELDREEKPLRCGFLLQVTFVSLFAVQALKATAQELTFEHFASPEFAGRGPGLDFLIGTADDSADINPSGWLAHNVFLFAPFSSAAPATPASFFTYLLTVFDPLPPGTGGSVVDYAIAGSGLSGGQLLTYASDQSGEIIFDPEGRSFHFRQWQTSGE